MRRARPGVPRSEPAGQRPRVPASAPRPVGLACCLAATPPTPALGLRPVESDLGSTSTRCLLRPARRSQHLVVSATSRGGEASPTLSTSEACPVGRGGRGLSSQVFLMVSPCARGGGGEGGPRGCGPAAGLAGRYLVVEGGLWA